jgi:fermentation-respiration switch protein FrsA (DUF1100 family)
MRDRRRTDRSPAVAALSFALALGLVYAAACWVFWAYEPAFVFHQLRRPAIAPETAGLSGFTEVAVPTEDGTRLFGWWRPAEPGGGALVVLTGTGVSLSDYAPLLGDLGARGFGVLGIDYRGNGASPGAPSEAAWRQDARAAFDFVRAAAPRAKIAVVGESMGTGFAIGLGLQRPLVGVLLNSAYASVVRLYDRGGLPLLRLPFPARLLMADPIDSEALIGQLRVPLLMLHGTEDRAIPIAEARRLYAAAPGPKEMIEVPGAPHAQVWFGPYRERALAALTAWTKG